MGTKKAPPNGADGACAPLSIRAVNPGRWFCRDKKKGFVAQIVSPVGVGLLDRFVRFELPEHLVDNLAVANVVFCQHRGDDFLRRGVDSQVQFAPGTPL